MLYRTIYFNKDGECHREKGPAIVYAHGSKHWYRNNELHREDGPAIIYASGIKSEFFLKGVFVRFS